MKHLLITIFAAAFCAITLSAQDKAAVAPATVYKQSGVTIVSPDQTGWTLLKSDKLETTLEKRDKDGIALAGIKTIKTKIFETERDRLAGLEALKQQELNKFKLDSIHFNNTRFKGSACLQYDGTFPLDPAAQPKFARYNVKGYLCPLPETKDLAVQIEFSNYSNVRGFSEDLLIRSDVFFEKLVLPKAAAK